MVRLHLKSISFPPHHPHTPPLFVSTRDTTLLVQPLRFSILFATSAGSGLKGNWLMHILCKFHMRACYPWQVMLT